MSDTAATTASQISKDDARAQRLRKANSVKNRIWGEWQKHCLKQCDHDVRRYWICREEQGLMAPFRCRGENNMMKDCLLQCGRDEENFAKFRAVRLDQIEATALQRIQNPTQAPKAE